MKKIAVLVSFLFCVGQALTGQAQAAMKAEEVREALNVMVSDCLETKVCDAERLDQALLKIADYRKVSEVVRDVVRDPKLVSNSELDAAVGLCDQLLQQLEERTLFRRKRKLSARVMKLVENDLLERAGSADSMYYLRKNYAAQEAMLETMLFTVSVNLESHRRLLVFVQHLRSP
jgi:hypothetical protein